MAKWRYQAEQGTLSALSSGKRGPKPHKQSLLLRRVAELEKEKMQLQKKLKQAEIIIDVQKKISEILKISPEQNEEKN